MWVSAFPADGGCSALDGVQPEGSVRSGRRACEGQLSQSQSVSLDPGGCTRGNSCSSVLGGGPGARGLWARTDRWPWAEAGPRRWLQAEPGAAPVLRSARGRGWSAQLRNGDVCRLIDRRPGYGLVVIVRNRARKASTTRPQWWPFPNRPGSTVQAPTFPQIIAGG